MGSASFPFIWRMIGLFKNHAHTVSLHLSFQIELHQLFIILTLMSLMSLYKSANDIFGLLFLFISKSSKVLAKRELLYVPLIGWTWYFLEIVFCKRKWEEDRDTVIEGLKRLADYPEYMWVSVEFLF